jgi:hypothetical protein
MNDVINTLTRLILDNIRTLGGIACAVVMLVSLQHLVHHMVAEQTADAAMYDQLAKPMPMGSQLTQQPVQQPQWITVQ